MRSSPWRGDVFPPALVEDQDSHGIAEIAHGHPQVDYRGPKPKGQAGGGVHWGACGNHLGPGKAQGLCAVEHQQKKKRRMFCFLPGPVVLSRLLTFVEHQIRETYGLTLDSAFCPASSANTTLKVPLLVSLFHVTMSTK